MDEPTPPVIPEPEGQEALEAAVATTAAVNADVIAGARALVTLESSLKGAYALLLAVTRRADGRRIIVQPGEIMKRPNEDLVIHSRPDGTIELVVDTVDHRRKRS